MAREVSARTQLATFVALVLLAAASFGLSFARVGALSVPVALGIALAKALLVGLFFMELVKERLGVRATVIVAIFLVVTLLFFAVADVDMRG
jgi:cytochrome c oxidase subunit 4